MLSIKRVYEEAVPGDGRRYLVDRVWPRGISKDRLVMDGWLKDLAPSTGLRTWFSHDPARWDEFKSRYAAELAAPEIAPLLRDLLREALEGPVTLLYAARDQEHNHALFLREYLGGMAADRPSGPPHPEAPAS